MIPYRLRNLKFYALLGVMGIGAIALLPGDKDAQPTQRVATVEAQRPSYLATDVPAAGVDNIETASIVPLAPTPSEQEMPALVSPTPGSESSIATLPATGTSMTVASTDATAFPMDVTPSETTVTPGFDANAKLTSVSSPVNLRAGPSSSTQTLLVLRPGDRVSVIEANNGWVNVALADGQVGWVSAKYVNGFGGEVATATPDQDERRDVRKRSFRVNGRVAVRAGPSRTAERLFVIDRGDRVRVVERRGNWARIVVDGGVSGWVPVR
jgi:SH3-like domain-containing protein